MLSLVIILAIGYYYCKFVKSFNKLGHILDQCFEWDDASGEVFELLKRTMVTMPI
jgi:hypothetical protein